MSDSYDDVESEEVPFALYGALAILVFGLALAFASCCAKPLPPVTHVEFLPPRVGCAANPPPHMGDYKFHQLDGDGGPPPSCGLAPCYAAVTELSYDTEVQQFRDMKTWINTTWASCRVRGDGGP
jgi:hypothetical protein